MHTKVWVAFLNPGVKNPKIIGKTNEEISEYQLSEEFTKKLHFEDEKLIKKPGQVIVRIERENNPLPKDGSSSEIEKGDDVDDGNSRSL